MTPPSATPAVPLGVPDATVARSAAGRLRAFADAGVLAPADVHVAQRLGALAGEDDDAVLLAVALLVRSTRQGSVVLDLATARETTALSEDGEEDQAEHAGPDAALDGHGGASGAAGSGSAVPADLPWPEEGWAERCAASPLAAGPLRQVDSRLWLARYWDQEEQVARELRQRSATLPRDLDPGVLRAGLERLFPSPEDADQRLAAATSALSRVSVLAGGPGTGKTTTVSRVLALLREQHPGWRIALAAPTGKAAARLEEAVRSSTASLGAEDRERLGDVPATTLHRLLGWRPDARARFRHDASNRLPVEVVVVDEASMVSLTLMARLLEALRPTTRLVLVGDPDQLASVEAGAVLGDLVDRSALGLRTPDFAARLRQVLPDADVTERPDSPEAVLRNGVSALATGRRFAAAGEIAALAAAIREGDGAAALTLLRAGGAEVELVEIEDDAALAPEHLVGVRTDVERCGAGLLNAAARGDGPAALAALETHRLLCAHRRGPRGVRHWGDLAAGWIADRHGSGPRDRAARGDGHYAGEPLLVTANDYDAALYNGDTGVVVEDGRGGLVAVVGRGGAPIRVPLVRLGAVRTVHAMTVHRSQGSQFERVTVVLPTADSPLGTRETLYTAVTRAQRFVRVIGSPEALVAAVGRPVARATGLRERLRS